MLWTDLCRKLQDQTLAPLAAYVGQFPEVKVSKGLSEPKYF